jgi:hypothetical protein
VPQQVVEVAGARGPLRDAAVAEEALYALGGRRRGLLGEDRAEDGVGRGRAAVRIHRDEARPHEGRARLLAPRGGEVREGVAEGGSEHDARVRGPHLGVREDGGEAAGVDAVHGSSLPHPRGRVVRGRSEQGGGAPRSGAHRRQKEDDMSDLADKAKGLADSDKGEKVTDGAIDKGQDAASKATGGKADGAAEKAGDVADQKLGQ